VPLHPVLTFLSYNRVGTLQDFPPKRDFLFWVLFTPPSLFFFLIRMAETSSPVSLLHILTFCIPSQTARRLGCKSCLFAFWPVLRTSAVRQGGIPRYYSSGCINLLPRPLGPSFTRMAATVSSNSHTHDRAGGVPPGGRIVPPSPHNPLALEHLFLLVGASFFSVFPSISTQNCLQPNPFLKRSPRVR